MLLSNANSVLWREAVSSGTSVCRLSTATRICLVKLVSTSTVSWQRVSKSQLPMESTRTVDIQMVRRPWTEGSMVLHEHRDYRCAWKHAPIRTVGKTPLDIISLFFQLSSSSLMRRIGSFRCWWTHFTYRFLDPPRDCVTTEARRQPPLQTVPATNAHRIYKDIDTM